MFESRMFEDIPEGFRMATSCDEDKKLVSLTIAQAFADCFYPVPSTDMSYKARFRWNYLGAETWVNNTLEYGNILTNEDYSAVMLVVPLSHVAQLPFEKIIATIQNDATPDDIENLLAIWDYIGKDEAQLEFPDTTIYLEVLAVQPQRQGQHESTRLMNKLFEECEKEQRDILLMTNTEKNESIYKHFGFETILKHEVEDLNSTTYYMLHRAHG